MPEITPERLAEIEARCKAATKPPWKFSAPSGRDSIWMDVVDENGDEILSGETQPQPHTCQNPEAERPRFEQVKADLEFAAHARTDIPDLLAALKQAREERDSYDALLDTVRKTVQSVIDNPNNYSAYGHCVDLHKLLEGDPASRLKERDTEVARREARRIALLLTADDFPPKEWGLAELGDAIRNVARPAGSGEAGKHEHN